MKNGRGHIQHLGAHEDHSEYESYIAEYYDDFDAWIAKHPVQEGNHDSREAQRGPEPLGGDCSAVQTPTIKLNRLSGTGRTPLHEDLHAGATQ